MYKLAEKIKNLQSYQPADVSYKVNLSANESFFTIENKSLEQLKEALGSLKFNRYPDMLASGLIEKFAEFNNVNKNLVTAGNGSDELINLILETFLNKGEKIVVLNPDFSMYGFYSKLLELQVLSLEKKPDLKIDFKFLTEYINKNNVSAVIFSNPCNPTSLAENKEDIVNFIKSVDCLVIADEAYMEFYGQSILGEVEKFDNLIVLKTLSKAVNLAAVRLGFAISNKELTNVLRAAKSPYNVNTLSAKTGEIVLQNGTYIKNCIKSLIGSREFLMSEIKKFSKIMDRDFKIYDSQANFVYIETTKAKEIDEFLKSKNIVIRCLNNALRITGGNKEENNILIKTLKEISK